MRKSSEWLVENYNLLIFGLQNFKSERPRAFGPTGDIVPGSVPLGRGSEL